MSAYPRVVRLHHHHRHHTRCVVQVVPRHARHFRPGRDLPPLSTSSRTSSSRSLSSTNSPPSPAKNDREPSSASPDVKQGGFMSRLFGRSRSASHTTSSSSKTNKGLRETETPRAAAAVSERGKEQQKKERENLPPSITEHWDEAVRKQMTYEEIVKRDNLKDEHMPSEMIAVDKEMEQPRRPNLPASIPPVTPPDYKAGSVNMGWSFLPKPIQDAHEDFIAKMQREGKLTYQPTDSTDGKDDLLMSPEDQFRSFIDQLFVRLAECKNGEDLVDVLRTEWRSASEPLTSRVEALKRTLDAILNLGQIKQFAFQMAPSLDELCQEITEAAQKELIVYSTSELASLAWCLAKLGARPPKFTESFKRVVERRLDEFNMAELTDLFYCFTELRIESDKLYRHVRRCVLYKKPRSLDELTPEQLCHMCTAVMGGYNGLSIPRKMVMSVAQAVQKMWRTKPYLSNYSLLQLCRYFTFMHLFFPLVEFRDLVPPDLREKSMFAFKSGRVELYSPPFVDPMMRTLHMCHYGLMKRRQMPECVGLQGWWVWDYNRLHKPFSLEPANKHWYTRLDDTNRLLGQYMFRHQVLKRFRILPVTIPYYKYGHLTNNADRTTVIAEECRLQIGVRRLGMVAIDYVHALGVDVHGRLTSMDPTITPQGKIAWTWEELCMVNAMEGVNPTRFYNQNFRTLSAQHNYDDPDRAKTLDVWSPSTLEQPQFGQEQQFSKRHAERSLFRRIVDTDLESPPRLL